MKGIKRFLLIICSFVIPILLLYPIDYVYSRIAMRSNLIRIEAWYDMISSKKDADVLAMGSSRAYRHINPLVLDSVLGVNSYNMGITGSAFNRQMHKYNLYLKDNCKPKLIIQNIDYATMGYTVDLEKVQFLPFFWDRSMRKEIIAYEHFSFIEKWLPLIRYYGYVDQIPLRTSPRRLTKGYIGTDYPWDGTRYSTVDSISFHTDKTTVEMFDGFLAQCKTDNIKVVFVHTPIYIGATNLMTNRDEMFAFFNERAQKYDIPILDYAYMEMCYDTTYFHNATHLNKRASEAFTDILANDIKRMGIINNSFYNAL